MRTISFFRTVAKSKGRELRVRTDWAGALYTVNGKHVNYFVVAAVLQTRQTAALPTTYRFSRKDDPSNRNSGTIALPVPDGEAAILGISARTLYRKPREYEHERGIDSED